MIVFNVKWLIKSWIFISKIQYSAGSKAKTKFNTSNNFLHLKQRPLGDKKSKYFKQERILIRNRSHAKLFFFLSGF